MYIIKYKGEMLMEENQLVFYETFKPKEGKEKELIEIAKDSG